jgi:hypothetical protein
MTERLSRRLERLEDEIIPPETRTIVFDIRFVTGEGQVMGRQELTIHLPAQPPKKGWR